MRTVPLSHVITPAKIARAGRTSFPLLSMTMHGGLVDQDQKFKKRVASTDTSDYKVVRRGQLVVGFPIDEGVVDFLDSHSAGIVSPAYSVWDLIDESAYDRAYLNRFLKSPQALTYYKTRLRGSTARRRSLPRELFLALPVPVPPIAEQRRIATILDQADALRAKRRQVLAHLDALSNSVFREMFGEPAGWPTRWPMGTIGDLCQSVQYGTSAKAGPSGEWAILRMGNVTDVGRLDTSDLKYIDLKAVDREKYTVAPGDLLFNRTNSVDKVGKTAVVRDDRQFAVAGYLIRVRMNSLGDPEFVSAYLMSDHGKAVRRNLAKAAVNQANINASELKRIPIAIPPIEAQRRFAAVVGQIEQHRTMGELALADSETLFASLQSLAFRGDL